MNHLILGTVPSFWWCIVWAKWIIWFPFKVESAPGNHHWLQWQWREFHLWKNANSAWPRITKGIARKCIVLYIRVLSSELWYQSWNVWNGSGELLLGPRGPHALKVMDYPIHAKFTCLKQKGDLILPSPAVLKIIKAAEVLFKKRVQWLMMGNHLWKKHWSKDSVCCIETFWHWTFLHESSAHFFQLAIGVESSHLTSLLKLVTHK